MFIKPLQKHTYFSVNLKSIVLVKLKYFLHISLDWH